MGHWEVMGVPTAWPLTRSRRLSPEDHRRLYQDDWPGHSGQRGGIRHGDIARLGEEHQKTGFPIVYTSADSVFQIAAHEETVPLATLYQWCQMTREMLDNMASAWAA